MRLKNARGFTLIELVVVMLILTILAISAANYISFGTQIYVTGQQRQQTLSASRFVVERLSREIQGAIPNSIRIGTSGTTACIEFAPIKASGAYRTDVGAAVLAPIAPNPALNQIDVISWQGTTAYANGDRLYIYPTLINGGDIYVNVSNVGQSAVISSVAVSGTAEQLLITFDAAYQFAQGSNINRYYTADHSVQYCLIETGLNTAVFDMYRFQFTNFNPTMQFAAAASGVLMAENLTNDTSNTNSFRFPFKYQPGVLFSNSVVNLFLEFSTESDDNMFFNHEVHIPNVP